MNGDERLDALESIEAIKQLKARYFRFIDAKQWDPLVDVFTPDATMDMSAELSRWGADPSLGLVSGAEAIVSFIRQSIEAATTVHHGHMPEITLTGPETAEGHWAMEDLVEFPEGSPFPGIRGAGYYDERYARVDGAWRIDFMRLNRLHVAVLVPHRRT